MIDFNIQVKGGTQIAAQLLGYGSSLEASMSEAMQDVVEILSDAATANMHWKNPSGDLEDSIYEDSQVIDAWHAEVGSSLPYAARREWGFSGMVDSLGRYFRDDPGAFYLTHAQQDHSLDITERIQYAAIQPLNPLGV